MRDIVLSGTWFVGWAITHAICTAELDVLVAHSGHRRHAL